MFRAASKNVFATKKYGIFGNSKKFSTVPDLPAKADVVIIGGGNVGCNTLYQLSKRGVKAVLLERNKITSGTTWHTAGLIWRQRPNDVETQILANTTQIIQEVGKETDMDPGWINNGGIFIAHNEERLDEYRRFATLAHLFGLESHILGPEETVKLFPLLDPKAFYGSLWSPADGVVDPSMLCNALVKAATQRGGKLVQHCSVKNIIVDSSTGVRKITGVETEFGTISTEVVVNACGAWSREVANTVGLELPLVPMKHAYVVTESMKGVKGLPNIRDHDSSVYFRIQGESICMGGYEKNPEILKQADLKTKYDTVVKQCEKMEQAYTRTEKERDLSEKDKLIFDLSRTKLELYWGLTNVTWDYTMPLSASKATGYIKNKDNNNYIRAFQVNKDKKPRDACTNEMWKEVEEGAGEVWEDIVAMRANITKKVDPDFHFGLYDLNFDVFGEHIKQASKLCPPFGQAGIKSTVCGPESFTPDHKPIVGEDPRLVGLFHACGFNSGGMQLGGGCAEQLALWITQGRPDIHLYAYDIRRFTPIMRTDRGWIKQQSHENYTRTYSIEWPNDDHLAGRNLQKDMFHDDMVEQGAVMEQKQGWERPGFFLKEGTAPVQPYDWYGAYGHAKNTDTRYEKALESNYTFGFPKHHDIIAEEALACRNRVALFNMSYFAKFYLSGPDAQEAADWLFTANTRVNAEKVVYTCALNSKGGVEADVTVIPLNQGLGTLVGPILKGQGFYIVAGGASGYQTFSHIKSSLQKKKFQSVLTDATNKIGVLSIQGPKSGEVLQAMTETPITDEHFPFLMSKLISVDGHTCRAIRVSFVGELGYELHIPIDHCEAVYGKLKRIGEGFEMRNAGFKALYALSMEKGYHLWGCDLRIDDNPIEANLGMVCRKSGEYQGMKYVNKLRNEGIKKRRAFFTLDDKVALYGNETIWRDDKIVGFLRRGEYAFDLDRSIGIGYVTRPSGKNVTVDYLKDGSYHIEVRGKKYDAKLFVSSPFDPKNQRVLGHYEQNVAELSNFED